LQFATSRIFFWFEANFWLLLCSGVEHCVNGIKNQLDIATVAFDGFFQIFNLS
jgi:hypothetical protein